MTLEQIEKIIRENHAAGPDAQWHKVRAVLDNTPTEFNLQCARAVLDFRKRRAEGMPDKENWNIADQEKPESVDAARFTTMVKGKVGLVNAAIRWLSAGS